MVLSKHTLNMSDSDSDIDLIVMTAAAAASVLLICWLEENNMLEEPQQQQWNWVDAQALMDDEYWNGSQPESPQSGGSSIQSTATSALRSLKKNNVTLASIVVQKFDNLCRSIDKYIAFKSATMPANMMTTLWQELKNMTTIDEVMMHKAFRFFLDRPNLIHTFLHSVSPSKRQRWLENMIPK